MSAHPRQQGPPDTAIINERDNDRNLNHLEATELGHLGVLAGSQRPDPARPRGLENDDYPARDTSALRQSRIESRLHVRKYWKNYIQLHVPHAACRDHLANERTFLSYQRTSLALSMLGIVTAQLFSLQHSTTSDATGTFGYHRLGQSLASTFQVAAIIVVLIGGHRFWRQQMNMARGMVMAGGWEIWTIMVGMLVLLLLVFGLLLAVDVAG